MNDNDAKEPSADEKARRLREVGDGTAVYGEVGQNDEQRDSHQADGEEAS